TLRDLVRLAAEAGGAHSGSLYLVDEGRGVLKPVVLYNLPADYVAGCGDIRIGDQCCGRAVESKKPWIVSDMLTDPLFASGREASRSSGIRAAFSVPVIDAFNRCIGSLACHYAAPHTPSNYELERNHLFATLIAFALSAEAGNQKPEGVQDSQTPGFPARAGGKQHSRTPVPRARAGRSKKSLRT
ncbi:MAG: GAF domain-containing protein, partial [Terriglobales bacterium]